MGKTIHFIRHAKSSWANPHLDDFDRPLNKRGLRDGPFMAQLLQEQLIQVDAIVSSPANRAITTASYFAEAFGMSPAQIITQEAIYEAFPDEVLRVIHHFPKSWRTVLVFGHNPAFTQLANQFSETPILNVPTCGICRVESTADEGTQFDAAHAKHTLFQYPKQFFL